MESASDSLFALAGTRVVVVGTGGHEPGARFPHIPSVAATVTDLARAFTDLCGLAPANLRTVLDPPTPNAVDDVLTAAATEATDALVLYFVCHGVIGEDNDLYLATLATLATRDPTHGLLSYQAFPYAALHDVVRQSRARSVLVVLDCCFAARAHGVTRHVPESLSTTAQAAGFYLLAASGRGQPAWAPDGERYTSFSGELMRLLWEGDPGGPEVFTVDHVYRALRARAAEKSLLQPHRQAADNADRWPFARNSARLSLPPAPISRPDDELSPYRGLSYFRPEDAGYFFGRDSLVDDLVARISKSRSTGLPVLVTGSSGVGKWSLLRAGLIPAVERMASKWHWLVLTPGAYPCGELAIRLSPSAGVSTSVLRDRLVNVPFTLARLLAARNTAGDRLLVVDQFEQLFDTCRDERERHAFIRELAAVARPGVVGETAVAPVVIGMRAGFFGQCARYPDLVRALGQPVVVPPLDHDGMRDVIVKPAAKAGLVLEPGLADRLLSDVGGPDAAHGALPLLSHALLSTWQCRSGNRLTLHGYQATGGIEQALARTANAVIDRLDPDGREVARRLLLRLVRVGVGTVDVRLRLPATALGVDEPETRAVLDRLVAARLVSVDEDTVQITHDALLRAWPRLRDWIAASRAELLVRQQLSEAAASWDREDRDTAFLWPRNRLAAAEAWRRDPDTRASLGRLERDFLDASARQRRKAKRLRELGIAVLVILLVASLAAAGYAIWQQRVADEQRAEAEASRNLAFSLATARTAGDLRDVDPTLAMQLGVAAFRTAHTTDARSAVLSSVSLRHRCCSPGTPVSWWRRRSSRVARSWPPAPRTTPCGCGTSGRIRTTRPNCPDWTGIPGRCTKPSSSGTTAGTWPRPPATAR